MLVTRRNFFKTLLGSTLALGGGTLYGAVLEPRWLDVSEITVSLPGAHPGAPVRILHLSDFHASHVVPLGIIASAIRTGLALKPDVICVTGDFVTARLDPAWDYVSVLRQLSATAPTLACLGNHDGGPSSLRHHGGYPTTRECRDLLASANIRLLLNDVITLTFRGQPVQFVGAGDFWSGDCNPGFAFARLVGEPRHPRVVLNHNPDAKLLFNEHSWDLMLCGHTHGGQISIPFVGTPFAPVVDKRYVEGLRPWNGRLIYVNRGVGSLYGIRLNCRPEVALITLS